MVGIKCSLWESNLFIARGWSMSSQSRGGSSSQGGTSTADDDRSPVANYPIIARDELELGEQLGAGAYGSVYRGIWKTKGREITVALKKVFMLEKEADILSKIRHRNIIQFFGVSQTNPDFFIVTEFAEGGSLYDYLHKAIDSEIDFDQIINWSLQVASGVAYLHYEAPETIIHRDLKSKNVVMSRDLVCKLCDFGTSKNLTHSWTAPTWGGTAAWMSPEIINQKDGITTATDVWSYAVVLWEMISREVPYKGLTEFRIYSMIAQQGVTLVIPEKCPSALSNLMKNCWKVDPKDRYDMRQIISSLESMQVNRELSEECGRFLKLKDEWMCEIEKQLQELEAQKLDYAKKLEELARRERALKRREETQRGMDARAIAAEGDVAFWDEEQVCQWMRQISIQLAVRGDVLDHLVALFLHHNINGNRLLDITLKDLECLGICSLGLRSNIFREIKTLRQENHRIKNFPSLQVSRQLDQKKKFEKLSQPLSLPLIIHVTMYTRLSGFSYLPKFRYKILVDTDWEESYQDECMPADLLNSHVLIKSVCISILSDDKSITREPYRCASYPYTVSEWIDSPASGGEVEIVCALSYTDRVIRPRNTCIRTKLFDFSRAQTLDNKRLELLVRSYPTASFQSTRGSIASLNRQPYKNQQSADSGVDMSSTLKGVWRNRASVNTLVPPDLSVDSPSVTSTPKSVAKSPLWSNIAAGIRGGQSPSSASTNDSLTTSPNACENMSLIKDVTAFDLSQSPLRWPKPVVDGDAIYCTGNIVRGPMFMNTLPRFRGDVRQQRLYRTQSRQQMESRKLSGTVARMRRRPQPIILPKRKFMSSMRSEALNPSIEEAHTSVDSQGTFDGDSLLKDVFDQSTICSSEPTTKLVAKRELNGNDEVRLVVSDHKGEVANECGTDEKREEGARKSRRRRRHRPHKRSAKKEHSEHCSDAESLSTNISNCSLNGIAENGIEAKRETVHGGYQKWCWK
uniref:Mitogen-activated protein kinase kinase kinase n=1 Tax=Parascaris univalens TaxID=6257 RepID=A0A915APR1_PARUN